jgi:hypothetical protein
MMINQGYYKAITTDNNVLWGMDDQKGQALVEGFLIVRGIRGKVTVLKLLQMLSSRIGTE